MHASSEQVSCPLSEMRFNYMSFEPANPKDVHEIEKNESPTELSSDAEPDVIVLD